MDESEYKKEYEEILNDLSDAEKTPTTKEFPFDLISKRISFLIQGGDVLDNHIEELEESLKKVLKERKIPPSSAILSDYILLDINLFYESAEKRNIPIPLPPTKNDVERFRHNIMAHFQRGNNAEVVAEYKIIGKVGLLKIYNEWTNFRDEVFNLLNSKEHKEKLTEEAIEIRDKLHKNFSDLLNSGNYKNNQILPISGNFVKVDMRLVSNTGSESLSTDDLSGDNTKYYMKIFPLGTSQEPFRIEVDNIHPQAHINNPVTNERIDIQVENIQNMGYCGSVAFGLTMDINKLKSELLKYFQS